MAATGPGAAGMASAHQQLRRDEDLSEVLRLARHLSILLIFFPPEKWLLSLLIISVVCQFSLSLISTLNNYVLFSACFGSTLAFFF